MEKQKLLEVANKGMLNGIVELTTIEDLLVDAKLGIYFNINDFIVANTPTREQEKYLNKIGFVSDGTYDKGVVDFAKTICKTPSIKPKIVYTKGIFVELNCLGYEMYVSANGDGDGYLVAIDGTHTIDDDTLNKTVTSMFNHINALLAKIYK